MEYALEFSTLFYFLLDNTHLLLKLTLDNLVFQNFFAIDSNMSNFNKSGITFLISSRKVFKRVYLEYCRLTVAIEEKECGDF